MSKQSFKQKLIDFGLTEEDLALRTVRMLDSNDSKESVAAFNKVWKLYDLEETSEKQNDGNILIAMGMDHLMMTVQDRRRLGIVEQAEVVSED